MNNGKKNILFIVALLCFNCPLLNAQTIYEMPTSLYGAVIADYDLDGDNDVIVGSTKLGSDDADSIIIMFNDGWGNFTIVEFQANSGVFIYCEDLNNDGYPDIISRDADSIFFHENDKQGGLGNEHKICHTIGNRRIGGIADMDTNGYVDIVYYGIQVIDGWGVAYNLDGYNFNDVYIYYTEENEYIAVGNLNDDNLPDVLVTNLSSENESYIMYNYIDSFEKEVLSTAIWISPYIFDVDGDGKNEACLEFDTQSYTHPSTLKFYHEVHPNDFEYAATSKIKEAGGIECIEDFDLDGYQDICITVLGQSSDPTEDSMYIYRNDQDWDFKFYDKHYIGEPWYFQSIISGDLNMDGYSELITVNYYQTGYIQILWNDGTGHFIDTNSVYVNQQEIELTDQINVYPNPTKSIINIDLPLGFVHNTTLIEIVNIHGSTELETTTESTSIEIDLRNFDSGIHIVKIHSGQTMYVKKIIKH